MAKTELVLISFSIIGLLFINFFQPQNKYSEKTIQQVKQDCTGFVKIKANLTKTFVSRKGAKIGVLQQNQQTIMAVFNDFYYPSQNTLIYATASRNGEECWLFVKKIKLKKI